MSLKTDFTLLSFLQDYYICKLTSCQTMIMFENCGARSKILNHYTSHFQVLLLLNVSGIFFFNFYFLEGA